MPKKQSIAGSQLEGVYNHLNNTPSDINEHFPLITEYASKCEHITEMGVRDVVSTFAFFAGHPKKMISYDLGRSPNINFAYDIAREQNIDFEFKQNDVLKVDIEPTDLLFIDTLHTYGQLKQELKIHASKARKYLMFHDTTSYENRNEFDAICEKAGLWPAIEEFLNENKEWKLEKRVTNNNGLTILTRLPKVSVVIPTYKHLLDCLKPCLESIIKFTNLLDVEVLIVANGCGNDGTKQYIESLGEPFKLIWIDEAVGFIKAINEGIKASLGEFVILLNNDTVLLDQAKNTWVDSLLATFQDPKMAVAGPMMSRNEYIDKDFLIFFCVMIKKSIFDEIGLLDEIFGLGFCDDVDFCMRAINAGYKIVQVPQGGEVFQGKDNRSILINSYPIYHAGEKTFEDDNKQYGELIARNSQILKNRYLTSKPKVYDCFSFFNELDVLEIRLNELDFVVDRFVLVEARLTHTGKPKPLYFEENKQRFAKFLHKIEHVVVDFPPANAWYREHLQRDQIIVGLQRCKPQDTDIVIVSDADEIPNPISIKEYLVSSTKEIGFCKQRLSYYFINCISKGWWYGSRITTYTTVKQIGAHAVRLNDGNRELSGIGWHFSFLTGNDVSKVSQKISSFGHEELDRPDINNEENIKEALEKGRDVFKRQEEEFTFTDIDNTFPLWVQQNKEKYLNNGLIRSFFHGEEFSKIGKLKKVNSTVTAIISTKNRYFTTLPNAILSIINQTHKVDEFILFDDGEHKDLREDPMYKHIFALMDLKKITWKVVFGIGKGQVFNHQKALELANTEWVWRLDDDNIAEANCLQELLANVDSKTGAIGGLVIDPLMTGQSTVASNKIEDIYLGMNEQWFEPKRNTSYQVDHLYSSFLLRVKAAKEIGGYCKELSQVGHREETLLTYGIKKAGWEVLVNPKAKTWHFKNAEGGIRSYRDPSLWEHDEQIFRRKLNEWGIQLTPYKLIVLDNGLGDHLVFKSVFPEIKEKYRDHKIIIAECYPEVFADEKDVIKISIAEAMLMTDISQLNVYRYLWDHTDKHYSLADAFRRLYGI